jgi:hypothetical protein
LLGDPARLLWGSSLRVTRRRLVLGGGLSDLLWTPKRFMLSASPLSSRYWKAVYKSLIFHVYKT